MGNVTDKEKIDGTYGDIYDRFLSSTDAVKISLTYSKQIVKSIPSDSHDIKIDWIVTEDENVKIS